MMRGSRLSLLVGSLCAGLVLSCGPSAKQFSITHVEKRASLDNGLRMVVMPDKTTPLIQVDVRYEVGSKEDPQGKAGLAHLVEHMMFQHRFGAPDTPVEQRPPTFEILPQIATGFNAYTNWDTTHYYVTAPKEDLETVLRLEAARMATGCDTIPEEQFEREREVVRNEIRMRTGNADGQQLQAILDAAYPDGHAYRQMIGGNDAQLASITFQDVCKFMKEYYVPSRATVIVTGNAEPEQVGKMVQYAFGAIPAGTPAPLVDVKPVALQHKQTEIQLDIERDTVHVLFAMPSRTSDEYAASQQMVFIVSSALRRFARDWKLGSVSLNQLGGAYAPIMGISVEVRPGKSVKEVLGYVWKAVDLVRRQSNLMLDNGTYLNEKMSRLHFRQNLIQSLEPLAARSEFVANMVQFDPKVKFDSNQVFIYEGLDRVDQIDMSKYKSFVKKILDKKKAVVLVAKANKEGIKGDRRAKLAFAAKTHDERPDAPIDLREAKRPLKAPQSDSILKDAIRYELSNGMKVMLLPYEGLPIVHANLVFNVGSVHEPEDKSGLSSVAAGFLSIRPDLQGQDAYSQTGVFVSGGGGSDTTTFTARGISIYLEVVIKGLERIVKTGYIEQQAIEDYRTRFKETFKRPRYKRDYTYQRELQSALYGAKHPYVTKGSPTPSTLGKIGRDEAISFVRKHYTAANATLIVTGNFDVEAAKRHIKDNFGGWGKGHKDEKVTAQAATLSGPNYIGVVGRAEDPQMQLTIAYPAPAGIDGQQAARMVLAEMLNQRMATIRTELGSTYGTYAGRRTSVGPSAYQMGGLVDVQRAGESLKYMREQIDGLRKGDGFDKDFIVARRIVLKRLLGASTESYTLAGRLRQIAVYDLPPDYYDTLIRYVAAVPPAQIKALLATELDPSKEIIVAMAGKEQLSKAFDEAGIDKIRIVDPELN